MKNTKLIIAFALALGLASCGSQPKSNPDLDNATDTTVANGGATVSAIPYEWNFDLLWNIFLSVPDEYKPSYMLELNDGYASVEKAMKDNHDQRPDKNGLYILHSDEVNCTQSADIHCYKYADADKVLVHYLRWDECEPRFYTADMFFAYDLNNGSLTEVARPIEKLGMKEFYDDADLADLSPEEMGEFEAQWEYSYSYDVEGADLHEYFFWFDHPLSLRSKGLAYVWNGNEFVRKPEADVMGVKE